VTNFLKAVGIARILVGLATVTAELKAGQLNTTVRESQGVTTELSANASAITYWVNEADGWRAVTTVDTLIAQNGDSGEHAIVRFSSVLLPGQSQIISIPGPFAELQQALRIRRLGGQLEIERVTGSA
jgi:hypothetical protein